MASRVSTRSVPDVLEEIRRTNPRGLASRVVEVYRSSRTGKRVTLTMVCSVIKGTSKSAPLRAAIVSEWRKLKRGAAHAA